MKKLLLSSLLLFIVVIFNSCSSNNTAGGQVNPNTVGTPFTLKYEIITPSSISTTPPAAGASSIQYTNATGQLEMDVSLTSLTSGTTWTKEIVVTTSNRPFPAVMYAQLFLNTSGTAIGNIYVNGRQVSHVEKSSIGTANSASVQMTYSVY